MGKSQVKKGLLNEKDAKEIRRRASERAKMRLKIDEELGLLVRQVLQERQGFVRNKSRPNLMSALSIVNLVIEGDAVMELQREITAPLRLLDESFEQDFCAACFRQRWALRKQELFQAGCYDTTEILELDARIGVEIAKYEGAAQDGRLQLAKIVATIGKVANSALERKQLIASQVERIKGVDDFAEFQKIAASIAEDYGDDIAKAVVREIGYLGLLQASASAAYGSTLKGIGRFLRNLGSGIGNIGQRMGGNDDASRH